MNRTQARRSLCALLTLLALFCASPVVAAPPRIALIYAAAKFEELESDADDPQSDYRTAIEDNGGCAVVISQTFDPRQVDALLTNVQGVLLPGGIDVHPSRYGEEERPACEKTDDALDTLELRVLQYAKERDLPVLGVCRGHQILNVFYGGSLIQDIPTEYRGEPKVAHRYPKESEAKREHAIAIEPGSLLRQLLGTPRITVNTYHHQAVKDLAPGFTVTARSDDGLVEAIEAPGDTFILGVQFHPEKIRDGDPRFNALFARLIEQAAKRSAAATSASR